MTYLLLAIFTSAMVSVIMRLSADKVKGNMGMLFVNYLTCLLVAAANTDTLLPPTGGLAGTVGMGAVNGVLYLLAFVLFQSCIRTNGIVLSSVFMKLGLLVPIVVSVCFFGEMPALLQILGFAVAVGGIVLINYEKGAAGMGFRANLLLLLLCAGGGDAMSKVFEEVGDPALSAHFLLFTFGMALVVCVALMLRKGERPGKWEILFGVCIGVPNFYTTHFLLRSLSDIPAVIAYPTYSVGTVLVVTLTGVLAFRERLRRQQWLALGVIAVALVLLNI